jgi:hypothetical protein
VNDTYLWAACGIQVAALTAMLIIVVSMSHRQHEETVNPLGNTTWRVRDNPPVCVEPMRVELQQLIHVASGGLRIITSSRGVTVEEEAGRFVGEGDALASVFLGSLVARLYPELEFRIQSGHETDSSHEWERCNLVVVGGPMYNPVSRALMARLDLPYSFREHDIVDSRGKATWGPSVSQHTGSERTEEHFGLLIRARSPFAPEGENRTVLASAGCHMFGTFAGAELFTNPELVKKVAREVGEDEDFLLVLAGLWRREDGALRSCPENVRIVKGPLPL